MRLMVAITASALSSSVLAADSISAQICEIGKSTLGSGVHSVSGTGEGCSWRPAGSKNLSAYVHLTGQKQTVAAMKEMMDASSKMPIFKRVSLGVCASSEIMAGDAGDGEGPGGMAYAECGERVLVFSFQGASAYEQVRPLAKRLSEAKLAK